MKYVIYASPSDNDSFGFFDKGGFIEPLHFAAKYTLEEAKFAILRFRSKDPNGQYHIMFVID